MNIGQLTEYASVYRRVEQQSASGAIEKNTDTLLGNLFVRINAKPTMGKEIADGPSDTTTIELLARYFDVYEVGMKAQDFIEIDSRYYKIKGFAEDSRYGIKTAILINAEMMNQGAVSIS